MFWRDWGMAKTITLIKARHAREIFAAYQEQANAQITQTEAARRLGVKLTALNAYIMRHGINWPVKQQGRKWKTTE